MGEGMVPLFLNKIKSDKKAIECCAIFNERNPTPSELLWLIKFLQFAGYSKQELQEIINTHALWAEYNMGVAYQQLENVF